MACAYDGLSRLRKSKTYTWISGAWVLQNETYRVCDGMDIIQERDGNDNLVANVNRAGNIGGILARTTSAGSVYYHSDGDGNVVQLTNSMGGVVASYSYNAFGTYTYTSTGTAATANPYTFSSKEQFGGLYNFGYRYYMAGSGRWLNRDPIREAGGLNLYGYVGNDPEDYEDAYGFIPEPGPLSAWERLQLRLQVSWENPGLQRRLGALSLGGVISTGAGIPEFGGEEEPILGPSGLPCDGETVVPEKGPVGERPVVKTGLSSRVTEELKQGETRTPAENRQARNFFERNKDAAKQWWSERNGNVPWPKRATAGHPRALADGGDPLFIAPEFDGPNAPHQVPNPAYGGLTDAQRWGMQGGRPRIVK